jgi:small subunit ribosomal protein S8
VKFIKDDRQGVLRLTLKYGPDGAKVINGLKRISKPGLRVYAKKDQVPKVLGGLGIAIISTSRGIMTDRNARAAAVGGEVLAFVW